MIAIDQDLDQSAIYIYTLVQRKKPTQTWSCMVAKLFYLKDQRYDESNVCIEDLM